MRRPPQTIKAGSGVKVTFDGNSLVQGQGGGGTTIATVFSALAGSTGIANVSSGGQTWADMTSVHSDVDAAYDGAKTNVLFIWETTNSVFNSNLSTQQTIDDAVAYVAAVKAAHPAWKIVMVTTIPRRAGTYIATEADLIDANQRLDSVDAYFLSNYRAVGLDAVTWVRRPGSPFLMPDYTTASFLVDNGLWSDPIGSQIHLNAAGYTVIGQLCWETFTRLRAR